MRRRLHRWSVSLRLDTIASLLSDFVHIQIALSHNSWRHLLAHCILESTHMMPIHCHRFLRCFSSKPAWLLALGLFFFFSHGTFETWKSHSANAQLSRASGSKLDLTQSLLFLFCSYVCPLLFDNPDRHARWVLQPRASTCVLAHISPIRMSQKEPAQLTACLTSTFMCLPMFISFHSHLCISLGIFFPFGFAPALMWSRCFWYACHARPLFDKGCTLATYVVAKLSRFCRLLSLWQQERQEEWRFWKRYDPKLNSISGKKKKNLQVSECTSVKKYVACLDSFLAQVFLSITVL